MLTQLPVHGSYVTNLLTGLVPMTIGMGLVFVPITLLGTGGVRADDAGLASGLFNTAQQVGGSLGLAILSTRGGDPDEQHPVSIAGHPSAAQVARRTCPDTTSRSRSRPACSPPER